MTTNSAKIFCLGKDIVRIEEDMVYCVNVSEERVKKAILEQIEKGERRPVTIFTKALESILGLPFLKTKYKKKQGNSIIEISIHDSEYYREMRDFIMDQDYFKKAQRFANESRQKEAEFRKKEGKYFEYMNISQRDLLDRKAMYQKRRGKKY